LLVFSDHTVVTVSAAGSLTLDELIGTSEDMCQTLAG
jgi:hypothetical protein